MKRLKILCIAMSFLIFLGCDKSNSPAQNSPTINVTVDVNPGSATRYFWDGGNVSRLTVARTSDRDTPVWGVVTHSRDGLVPPVSHRIVPTGANETFTIERSLTPGIEYQVSVVRVDGTFGTTDFTQ